MDWTNIRVKLGDLKAWSDNPRQSTKAQAKKLLQSFDEFGQVETIAVSPDLEVYNGHQRLSALLQVHGKDYQIDARQASRTLTEDERKKLTIFLHAGATGSWDWDTLSGWDASEMISWGLDDTTLKEWKHDISGLGELLKSEKQEPVDAEPQIDKAEELRVKWGVESGNMYQIGDHRLLCGDCTKREDVERVMGGEKADMVFTDPPYGMNLDADYEAMSKNSTKVKGVKYSNVIGDDKDFDPRPYIAMFPEAKEQLWWGADYYYDKLPPNGSWMVWVKRNENMTDIIGNHFEVCWSMGSHKRRVIYKAWSGVTARNPEFAREHPTEKPIALSGDLINEITDISDIVVDIFAGSGTTMVACQNLSRKCRAIEISPAYCGVILERMSVAFPELEISRI